MELTLLVILGAILALALNRDKLPTDKSNAKSKLLEMGKVLQL